MVRMRSLREIVDNLNFQKKRKLVAYVRSSNVMFPRYFYESSIDGRLRGYGFYLRTYDFAQVDSSIVDLKYS